MLEVLRGTEADRIVVGPSRVLAPRSIATALAAIEQ
jgi:hypothetical protein